MEKKNVDRRTQKERNAALLKKIQRKNIIAARNHGKVVKMAPDMKY